jgi:hypothetical protein
VLRPARGKTTVVRLRKDKEGANVYSKGNSAEQANAVAVCSELSTMLGAVAETAKRLFVFSCSFFVKASTNNQKRITNNPYVRTKIQLKSHLFRRKPYALPF